MYIKIYLPFFVICVSAPPAGQLRRGWGGGRGAVLAPASDCRFACCSRFQRLRVTNLQRKISKKSTFDLLEVKLRYKVQKGFRRRKQRKFSKFGENDLKKIENYRPRKRFWTL